jgi:hypothetical protein
MKVRRISTGIVLAAAIAALGGAMVQTTGADGQRGKPDPKPVDHTSAPPHNNHEKEEASKLNQILANQRLLLQQLGELNDSTLPNAIAKLGPVLDGIKADTAGILVQISGLEAQCSLPDLLPVQEPGFSPPYSYCRFSPDGKLRVQVVNQGGVPALGFTTRVTFLSTPVAVVNEVFSAGLAAFGGSTDVLFTIPANCFVGFPDKVCNFSIEVDSANAVGESNEGNNNVAGTCSIIG